MTTEIKFQFATLDRPARRHIRVFQMHQFLDRFAMGLTVSVVALALTDRGMDLFQIALLFGVYALTTFTMELPFGGLADSIGRKPVFLTAVISSLISLGLFLATRDFFVLALSFVFIGFGRALRSGTLDAWFVETFRKLAPNVDVQPALAKAQWANAVGLALGAILGGLLPDLCGTIAENLGFSRYDVSYAASFGVMLGVFVFTLLAIDENQPPLNITALGQGFAHVPNVIRETGLRALRHPVLSVLLGSLAFFLMATNPVEVLWPTHAKPMLQADYANTVIGMITATYFFSIAIGASLSPHISRIFNRQHALTLAVTFASLAGLQIALALQGGISGFVVVFVLYSIVLGATESPASTIMHRYVSDQQRSTILSLRSMIQQLGAASGLVIAGAIAEIYTTPVAWLTGALCLLISVVLALILVKRSQATPAR